MRPAKRCRRSSVGVHRILLAYQGNTMPFCVSATGCSGYSSCLGFSGSSNVPLTVTVISTGRICALCHRNSEMQCVGERRNLAALAGRASGNISLHSKYISRYEISVESNERSVFLQYHLRKTLFCWFHFLLYRDNPYPPLRGPPSPWKKASHFPNGSH